MPPLDLLPVEQIACVVCGAPGTATTKALNGLPKGVVACDECRQAVKRREVGVAVNADGSLHVTDGRGESSTHTEGT